MKNHIPWMPGKIAAYSLFEKLDLVTKYRYINETEASYMQMEAVIIADTAIINLRDLKSAKVYNETMVKIMENKIK